MQQVLKSAVLGCTLALATAAACATTGSLVPPDGFRVPVNVKPRSPRECEPPPRPYTGKLTFPSKYEGSDAARDDLNEKAAEKYRAATEPITDFEKGVSGMTAHYVHDGDPATLRCVIDWLSAWASAGALMDKTKDHTGKSMRKWALASISSAYLRLKFSPSKPLEAAPEKAIAIERWLDNLGTMVKDDWRDQPLAKINNHEYWAAWAAMATGVALNRRDLYDWALTEYRIAAKQVDKDGFLPNELARDTRALAYHSYALEPLSMIAAFAAANGDDLASANGNALTRLANRVIAGVDDPRMFEARTGKKQVMNDLAPAKLAWLEPYCAVAACAGEADKKRVAARPLKSTRMGGDVSELFAPD